MNQGLRREDLEDQSMKIRKMKEILITNMMITKEMTIKTQMMIKVTLIKDLSM